MSAGHSTYTPKTGFGKWLDERLPLPRLVYDSFVAYPVPRNLNNWYTFGGILSLMLVVQIITGVGVNTGELLSSLVATAIVGGATMEASRAANVWGYRYHGEKVMGLDNELLVLRLLLE